MSWESKEIGLLAASLLRPFGLVGAAWLILRVLRIRHPASLHAVWTAVLIGMLLLPFLSVMTPHWTVHLLPPKREAATRISAAAPAVFVARERVGSQARQTAPTRATSVVKSGVTTIIWVYLAGLCAMAMYRVAGWALLWRVMTKSRPLRSRLLRQSDGVVAPVAVGVLRPVVILPSGWREWDANTRRAVLAHEFAHLRRRDALVSALAWWVKCLFWFHPLAWWVSRKVSELAELACDAAALDKLGDPSGYSKMLLIFAEAVSRAGQRVALPGLAMAAGSGMDRRIGLVFELSDGKLRKLARPRLLLALGVPAACLAATVGLGEMRPSRQDSVVPLAGVKTRSAIPSPSQPPALHVVAQLIAPPSAVAQPTVTSPVTSASPFETPPSTPSFEVVSVKPCSTDEKSFLNRTSAGLWKLNCQTVADLVRWAYVIFPNEGSADPSPRLQVETSDGPAWIDSDRYTIQAKAERAPKDMAGPMLQALLEDRFQLKVHRETRDVPVYALAVASGGLKMRPFQEGSCVPGNSPEARAPGVNYCLNRGMTRGSVVAVDIQGMSIDDFCQLYLRGLNRPVVDKTGLTGRFNFRLVYAQAFASENGPSGPPILVAMQEQLGLKLEPDLAPLEVLVVDRVERPTGN